MAKPGKTIDLSSLDTTAASNNAYKLELKHPVTKEGLGQYIHILGIESDTYREYSNEKNNKERRDAAMRSRRGEEEPVKTIEQLRAEGTEALVVCTVGFEGIILDGKPLEFSAKTAYDLYTRLPWVRSQVDDAVTNIANFMKA